MGFFDSLPIFVDISIYDITYVNDSGYPLLFVNVNYERPLKGMIKQASSTKLYALNILYGRSITKAYYSELFHGQFSRKYGAVADPLRQEKMFL